MDTAAPGASTSASIISSDTLAPANTPGSVLGFASGSTLSFDKIAQKRHRIEQGIPYRVTESPSPIFGQILPVDTDVKAVVTYSKGSCAWLGMNDNQTTVMVLNLANSERKIFTTDNRENLRTLHFSKPYIAAVSIRGYCHVWNIDTSQSSSFRIPSLDYSLLLINGTKVVVQYNDYVVHWCFNTRVAWTIQTGDFVVVLAPHPSEDQMTVVRMCRKPGGRDRDTVYFEECYLHIAKYALDSKNEWCLLSSHHQPLPVSVFGGDGSMLPGFWTDME